jgi:hypothetical protein
MNRINQTTMKRFEQQIEVLWTEQVAGRFMFHGMSRQALADPLDPDVDPFTAVRPHLDRILNVLQSAVADGFQFEVHEIHSKMVFSLKDILNWSKRDLEIGGIDFTSSYRDACGYANNFQGSQLKQNIKTIAEHLPERKNDPILAERMSEHDWKCLSELNQWITTGGNDHSRVVLWIRRSAPIFDDCRRCVPLGSLDVFSRNVITQIEEKGLSKTTASAISLFPKRDFCQKIVRKLFHDELAGIEDLQ